MTQQEYEFVSEIDGLLDRDLKRQLCTLFMEMSRVEKLIEEERAACADIADRHSSIEGIAQQIRDEIRARGKK